MSRSLVTVCTPILMKEESASFDMASGSGRSGYPAPEEISSLGLDLKTMLHYGHPAHSPRWFAASLRAELSARFAITSSCRVIDRMAAPPNG
jgi:hypothetical protein